ncbi:MULTISPECIES: Hsp20/alpha crystallin family protein [Halolamina]|uniref:HSP20 family protein n=1 Tax=Halolamina pelagica TaxID=699431 RepID=A0A1I5SF84_9EURY|nr:MULTISPECIES: Hsp20/alpha crystallin family protein [Halolamina]NHX37086.1 Hsp20/alpha crystallin family protein [Halolamina sp. R1-12]SFP69408.1 HSP20 family protein [Halolamina pelagica]
MPNRRDPFEEIEELFEQLNSGFAEMSREFDAGGAGTGGGIHVDVADADDEIVVTADVPGFDPEEIDVSVSDRQLRISAERSTETESEDEETQYYRRERTRRAVSRTVSLPTDVDEHEAAASYENGVLTVELPKAGGEDGTDIEIN